ncbi:histidinol-phosphate transaminase [Salinibacterium sp. NK8237]|uniref:histidinol-phosphate transaminase n=1 Tax=Salinibacterium sp. NK8237 TaxID=2792038 RepID=UPI0018CE3337|nr:histidinol-phosphate transaminase [Salinibacterium sp. NK8237]MBH0131590.1 histidinol-phosphate transaminase [Salinibacterium sp. NK8237]
MTSLSDLPIRDDLRGRTPYGAPTDPVRIQLNVNENTHPIPEAVATDIVMALAGAVMNANRYPDREFTELRESLAAYLGHGLAADNIWAANGSNEVLQQTLQAFGGPGRRVLGFPPTYSMHSIIASGTGTEWVTAPRDPGYDITPESVVAAIAEHTPDVVFLCSPNNPTGTPVSNDTIVAAYDATDGIVLVDEAYAEFSDRESALALLEGRPRLLVSRTMSKAFAFAGARVGYLAADPAIADALRLVRLPYHLSALTQAAAVAALAHAPAMLAMVDEIKAQRDRMSAGLEALGFTPVPSESNFVLFGNVADPQELFHKLLIQDILIRDVGIPHHLRVTAGTEEETTAFLDAMADLQTLGRVEQ